MTLLQTPDEIAQKLTEEMHRKYEGKNVSAYCFNGSILTGKAHFLENNWLELTKTEHNRKRTARCNLNYVIAITFN